MSIDCCMLLLALLLSFQKRPRGPCLKKQEHHLAAIPSFALLLKKNVYPTLPLGIDIIQKHHLIGIQQLTLTAAKPLFLAMRKCVTLYCAFYPFYMVFVKGAHTNTPCAHKRRRKAWLRNYVHKRTASTGSDHN